MSLESIYTTANVLKFFHRSLSCISDLKFVSTALNYCGHHVNKIAASLISYMYAHQLFLVALSTDFYQDMLLDPYLLR